MTVEATPEPTSPDPHELAARLNRRLAQLDWPVVAEVDEEPRGEEFVRVRRMAAEGFYPDRAPSIRIGAASLARPHLVESILAELRTRGWDRTGERPNPRADVFWCAPA